MTRYEHYVTHHATLNARGSFQSRPLHDADCFDDRFIKVFADRSAVLPTDDIAKMIRDEQSAGRAALQSTEGGADG